MHRYVPRDASKIVLYSSNRIDPTTTQEIAVDDDGMNQQFRHEFAPKKGQHEIDRRHRIEDRMAEGEQVRRLTQRFEE